jgi:hypothetical protein
MLQKTEMREIDVVLVSEHVGVERLARPLKTSAR